MLDIDMANELFKFTSYNNKDKSNLFDNNKVIDALAGIVRSRRRLLSPRDTGKLNSEPNQEDIIVIIVSYKSFLGRKFKYYFKKEKSYESKY